MLIDSFFVLSAAVIQYFTFPFSSLVVLSLFCVEFDFNESI
jgi:hypothetical protein